MRIIRNLIGILLFFVACTENCFSAPSVSGVSGTVSHGQIITISGSEFGAKNPVRPLMWDDAESAAANSVPNSLANASSRVGYSEWYPVAVRNGEAVPEGWRMLYRSFPYTPQGENGGLATIADGPHSRSTKFLSGGHYYLPTMDGNNPARDVDLTIPNANGVGNFEPAWYAHWYYRNNSEYPSCGSADNDKVSVIQSDVHAYGGSTYNNDFVYLNYSGVFPCASTDGQRLRVSIDPMGTCDDFNPAVWTTTTNPKNNWQNWEEIIRNQETNGGWQVFIDNEEIWGCSTAGDWFTNFVGQGIGSLTIGGYFRRNVDPPVGGEQSSNIHRLFDDIYVDSTLSRIMLTDNQNYDQATIVEPQIPSAWQDGSITADVNLGKLPDSGIAYLFVFDADNNHNATGFPVTIGSGGGDPTPPGSPSGLSVR